MICSRRLYKGDSYEICLPISDTGVTEVRFYTSGDVFIEKEPEISGDTMCFLLTKEDLDILPDGVLRYSYDGYDGNTGFVVVTPGDYSGSTLDDLLEEAFESGQTACSGSSCNLQTSKIVGLGGFDWVYRPGREGQWATSPKYYISGNPQVFADEGYDGLEDLTLTGGFEAQEAFDDGYDKGYNSGYTAGQAECSGDTCEGVYESGYTAGEAAQKAKLSALTITSDWGSYTNVNGWSSVTVNVPMIKWLDEEILENGRYTYDPYPDYKGYKGAKITVNVPDRYNEGYYSGRTDGYASGYSAGQEDCSGETIHNQNKFLNWNISDYDYQPDNTGGYYVKKTNVNMPGEYSITPDSGYTGLGNVTINNWVWAGDAYNAGYTSGYTDGQASCSGSSNADLIANLQGDYFVIPEGTTRLRNHAFYDTCFSSITIPDTVVSIGRNAFALNQCLTSITIPDSVQFLWDSAFYRCTNLQTAILGSGLTKLESYTFQNCTSLTGITIPSGITELDVSVFSTCPGLTEMTFESLTPPTIRSGNSLGSSAYTFPIYVPCESVEAYKTAFGQYYAPRITCAGPEPQSAATAITITVPQGLEPGDTGSTSVSTSPSGATTNLSYSSSDNSVATVDNNGNITAVGTGTTNICVTDSISQITECVQLTVNQSLLGDGDVTATVLPRLATSAVPLCSTSSLGSVSKMAIDGVEITPVSAYTFGDTNLHTLDVWYLTSTIPYDAFEYADRLKDVVIKDRMTVIGGRAFYWCTGITSVQIGSGITTINNSAFQGDKSITSITIPDAVNTIGTYVFSGCTSMISATIGTGMTTIPDGMFSVCSALTQVTVNGNVTEIGAEAFNECKSLTAYPFTNSLAVISQSAFKGCESLTSVVLPDSVVSAGTNAFEGCTGLTAVTLSTGLTEIANNMFSSCGTLQSVSLPDSITKIGERSFEGCSAMTSVVFGSGLTEIGDYAFQNCSYLRGIDIPETISKIGAYSFRFDTALQVYGITVRNTTPPWLGNQAFASTDDAPIYVPAGSVETYKTSTTLHYYWADYANRIQAIQ